MKVLIGTDSFPEISQTFISTHCQSLIECGWDVDILASAGNAQLAIELARDGLRCDELRLPFPKMQSGYAALLGMLPRSVHEVRLFGTVLSDWVRGRTIGQARLALHQARAVAGNRQYDVVHAHFGTTALAMSQLKAVGLLRAPFVVTFHGTDLNAVRHRSNAEIYARVFASADLITVGSRHMLHHFERLERPPRKVAVVPMGVNADALKPRSEPSPIGFRMSTIGRLVECKGTEFAVRAVAALRERIPAISLDVIGDGPLMSSLVALADQLGVADRVTFHGALAHKSALDVIGHSHLYVHPGIVAKDGSREGQGLAVVEAQALGIPVIASEVGGIPESVDRDRSAFLVPPGDLRALTERIELLAENSSLRRQLGKAGIEFVSNNLDQAKLTEVWIDLYQQAIADHAQR